MNPSDAEAVKLLSNTYLAMRVAFFNELDSLSLNNNLDSKSIICGISLDNRIGDFFITTRPLDSEATVCQKIQNKWGLIS